VELHRFNEPMSGLHGWDNTEVDELLLIVDRAKVTNRWVATLAVVVTIDPIGRVHD